MIMDTNNLQEVNETIEKLLNEISAFEDKQLNVIPFEGSWTAGQVAQHLILSGSGFVRLINGPVENTERPPGQLIEKIKGIFLDFDNKMKSPNSIVPQAIPYKKDELLSAVKDIQSGANSAIDTLDLSKTCTRLKLPSLGSLTRLEALWFINYHTQRHIRQLQNIRERILNAN